MAEAQLPTKSPYRQLTIASDTGKVPRTHACKMQLPHAGASILWIVAIQVWLGTASQHLLVVDQWGLSGIAGAGQWH
jgi:hypothetical protein